MTSISASVRPSVLFISLSRPMNDKIEKLIFFFFFLFVLLALIPNHHLPLYCVCVYGFRSINYCLIIYSYWYNLVVLIYAHLPTYLTYINNVAPKINNYVHSNYHTTNSETQIHLYEFHTYNHVIHETTIIHSPDLPPYSKST